MFFLPQYSLNCQRSYFTLEVPKTRNKLRATRTPDFEWVTWACSFQAVCKKFKNNNNKNTLRTFCFRKFLSYIQKWHFLWINRNFLFYNYRKKPQTVVPTHFFHLLRQHVLIMWKKNETCYRNFIISWQKGLGLGQWSDSLRSKWAVCEKWLWHPWCTHVDAHGSKNRTATLLWLEKICGCPVIA